MITISIEPSTKMTIYGMLQVSQLLQLLDSCKHHAFPVSPDRPTDSSLEFHLHGLITKSRILKMLEYRIGILVCVELLLSIAKHVARRISSQMVCSGNVDLITPVL